MSDAPRVDQIIERYEQILGLISGASKRSGRVSDTINLILVTKNHPIEVVESAIKAGIYKFGENYAEEALSKMDKIESGDLLEWHMIGHIQSRKASMVSERFDMVHSVDSVKIAAGLNRFAVQANRILPVLLECNTSGESSKYGWKIHQLDKWEFVRNEFEQILGFSNLKVQGLMTMAPYSENPEDSRLFFRILRKFRDHLVRTYPDTNLPELSMGMSGDFEVAVEEGATFVRIGRAILGERQ